MDWRCCAGKVLNVNYPRCRVAEIKGIRAARMAESRWAENYERREDPAGRPYWWIADFLKRDSGGDDTDIALMEGNWVSRRFRWIGRTGNCSAACRSGSASSSNPSGNRLQ